MSASDLLNAFNSVSQPNATCTVALLRYKRIGGQEWQIVLFRGNGAEGAPFEIETDALRANSDLNEAAKQKARLLLDQGKPAP